MFFNTPGKPTKFKKGIYLLSATILGIILSFLVHAAIEINYLSDAQSQGLEVSFYGGCALPPLLALALLIAGALGGFFLGRFWWRKIYIERTWAKRLKKLKK